MQASEGIYTMEKVQAIRSRASQLFEEKVDWAVFFREVLGVSGIVHQMYPDADSLARFEQTPEFNDLQQMLAKLRDRNGPRSAPQEVTRVITVRLPKSLHESLKSEAHRSHTSMNQLCISKLLQAVDEETLAADVDEQEEEATT